jgi:glycosyltransferase involved in cell wall biosynthesis
MVRHRLLRWRFAPNNLNKTLQMLMHGFEEVNQFHSGSATGDAVTSDMLEMQDVLLAAGFRSRVFAEHISDGLQDRIEPINSYEGDPRSLLIVHHSFGFDCMDKIKSLPDRKILKYHNITPVEFLPNESLRRYSEKGRAQLAEYQQHIEIAFGDSDYNRRELVDLGYRYTGILPIFFRPDALLSEPPEREASRRLEGQFNILFVGRIAPNKAQHDLVKIFDHYYKRFNPDARLLLVGSWEGFIEYRDRLMAEIRSRSLEQVVRLTGKVSASRLVAYYRGAQVLGCVSEHEGFCVPLLEAMAFDLPVVAYAEAAVPETLGGAGVLLDSKDEGVWSEVFEELRRSSSFRRSTLEKQRQRLKELAPELSALRLVEIVHGLQRTKSIGAHQQTLQIQGPFETSYSLAAVNRDLAQAIDRLPKLDVSIKCTEGPGDYEPKPADLVDKPVAKWLWLKSGMLSQPPSIAIRNLYPPRVADSDAGLTFLYSFWEDSLLPDKWIQDFNRHLDAVLVPSKHVEKVFRDSGLTIPVHTVGAGIEERFFDVGPRRGHPFSGAPFTFLNVSSGFPRKGIDVLLRSFFEEFDGSDGVRLIVKTFPNIHNTVADQIKELTLKVANPPEVVHIDRDLASHEIDELYRAADCLVYPTRCEGFGLPVAEAMAQKIPVIVTGYSGPVDFCSQDTAFLLNYQLRPSGSHVAVPGAMWAEPDPNHLRELMRTVYTNRHSAELQQRANAAYEYAKEHLRWTKVAQRVGRAIADTAARKKKKLAMITSWNSRCGIAEYSRHLIEATLQANRWLEVEVLSSPDEGLGDLGIPYHTLWKQRPHSDLSDLRDYLLASDVDFVHFQFNFGFFDLEELASTIRVLKHHRKSVILTLHSTADLLENGRVISLGSITSALREADSLIVHSDEDEKRLKSLGLSENLRVLPHGNVVFPVEDRSLRQRWGLTLDPVIGTFGFLLPHKGLLELLEATYLLRCEFPHIGIMGQCALHRDGISAEFQQKVRARIRELGLEDCILLSTDFVEPEEAALFLQMSDVIVLPYGPSAESASGAVRFALSAGRPVITTSGNIFRDVAGTTLQIGSNAPSEIASAVRSVFSDPQLADQLAGKARAFSEETSWNRIAKRYAAMLFDTAAGLLAL